MLSSLLAPLRGMLRPHFALSKTRLETLAILIVGLVNSRTVNLSHLASQFPGAALHASNYRRLQRFFQYVRFDGEAVAPLVMRMLVPGRSAVLALDRTHWKLGGKDVNILVLALATRRFRVPLLWTVLDHPGNSNTDQRIALMDRYLALFGVSSITILLADREFIGAAWLEFLCKNNIPFAIRLREDMQVRLEGGVIHPFRSLMRKERTARIWVGWLNGMATVSETRLDFAAKRLRSGEKLVIATNTGNPRAALNAYRKRWGIECLFADTKTRGFNIEDTHLTDPTKIATLLAVVTLACLWAYRSATTAMGRRAPRHKTHGRKEKSWFRIGLDALRRAIIHQPEKAIRIWEQNWPKRPVKTSLSR